MYSLAVLAASAAAVSVVGNKIVIGSVKAVSAGCQTLLNNNNQTLTGACGNATLPNSLAGIAAAVPQLIASLDQVCAPNCTKAVDQFVSDLTGPTCANEVLDPSNNITGADYGSAVAIFGAVACVKSNNTYCLAQEVQTLAPLVGNLSANATSTDYLNALTPLLSNTSFVCSDCIVQQVSNVVSIAPKLSPSVQSLVKPVGSLISSCPKTNGTSTNGTSGGTGTSSPGSSTTNTKSSALTLSGVSLAIGVAVASLF
ncbi:hypothetical protein HDV03_001771 [Kappamyces sp. JEL0829]|nr:hypothetical protein HDV03_001771 [Kappamyces sp. JEL0829]